MASAKVIHILPEIKQDEDGPGFVTAATFHNIRSYDSGGRAWMLYSFYAAQALQRNEGQPYCNDEWTAGALKWNAKTVRQVRKTLITAGVIKMIRKGRKNYIRLHYLPFKVGKGKHRSMGTENILATVMATTGVFDYWAKWYDAIQGNPTRFINAVRKEAGAKASKDKIMGHLDAVYGKVCRTGYGIEKLDNELSFFYYLAKSVARKIKKK